MKVFVVALSIVIFVGGLFAMGYSFTPEEVFVWEYFAAGLVLTSLAFFIPFHVLRWLDRG